MDDFTSEQWKPVPGWEGLYEVSDHGRVRTLRTTNRAKAGHIMKGGTARGGYRFVAFSDPDTPYSRPKYFRVSRLVAQVFLGNAPSPEYVVNHIDGNPQNNHVNNLEWCTQAENVRHAIHILGRRGGLKEGEDHPGAKLTDADARAIYILVNKYGYKPSKLHELFGVTAKTVRNVAKGRTWKHLRADESE